MFMDVHPSPPGFQPTPAPPISGLRSKQFAAARRVKHSVNVAYLGHKVSRHKLQLKDAVSRVNPFIFWRRAAECARVTKWPAELVTSEIAR